MKATESKAISPLIHDTRHISEVRNVTWIGLLLNIALAAFKFFAGFVGNSQTIIADAVHSLSDSSTDVAILIGVRYWSKPPDAGHPHGHRRIETAITTGIGFVLLIVGAGLVYNAVTTLIEGEFQTPRTIALVAALVSIVTKEGIFRYTRRVGKRIRSSAVMANAWHHRSDALSSIPAALAVAGTAIHPQWVFLDSVGAIAVSIFVFQAAWKIMRPAVGELVDAGAPPEDRERIKMILMSIPGVKHVHSIRSRYIGTGLQIDLHVMVEGTMSVSEGHDIAEDVKQRLLAEGPDVIDVVVHIEPYDQRA